MQEGRALPRYGMVIDLNKCGGCYACSVICKVENGTRPRVSWNRVDTVEWGEYPQARLAFIPTQCMHCQDPPCVRVCPTGASTKHANGIVTVDYERCIGCRYCQAACPYGARQFNGKDETAFPGHLAPYEEQGYAKHRLGTVEKCTFCLHRVEAGQVPACVAICTGKARVFGDLDDPASDIKKYIQSHKAVAINGTSFYYVPPQDMDAKFLPAQARTPSAVSWWMNIVRPGGKVVMGAAAAAVVASLIIGAANRGGGEHHDQPQG